MTETPEIPESLYIEHIADSKTAITTWTNNAGTPHEDKYDALDIDLPDLLDAINAEGLPVACPECKALASLHIPVKDALRWEVTRSHKSGCSAMQDRPDLHAV